MDLTEKILFYMKRYHMIPENKNIVVGLSGGADSVCLLYVLVALRKKLGLQLCAVHVHHGLRGVEADADEAYVRDICRAWDVPLKAIRIEAAALAKQWGIGCEEAGRRARYEIFEECLQEMGDCHGAIAVAHHRDDCAETLLVGFRARLALWKRFVVEADWPWQFESWLLRHPVVLHNLGRDVSNASSSQKFAPPPNGLEAAQIPSEGDISLQFQQ